MSNNPKKTKVPVQKIIAMLDDGYTPSEIARQLRLRTADVRRVLVTRWIELFT